MQSGTDTMAEADRARYRGQCSGHARGRGRKARRAPTPWRRSRLRLRQAQRKTRRAPTLTPWRRREVEDGSHRGRYEAAPRPLCRREAMVEGTGTPAVAEDAAASADVEASEDDAGADTMAAGRRGHRTARLRKVRRLRLMCRGIGRRGGHRQPWRRPTTAPRPLPGTMQRSTPEAGASGDDAGADTMAEVEDGTALATAGGCSGYA